MRACIDTNIWVSGIVFRGAPARVVQLALERKIVVVTSGAILDEVARILETKFDVPGRNVARLMRQITAIADVYQPRGELQLIAEDPADDLVVETALIGRARFLVSGDKKHLLPLKRYKTVRIISAQEFLHLF